MRVRVLREAGGVGDVVCALGACTAIKRALPQATVGFYTLEQYVDLARRCPDVDVVVAVPSGERRDRDDTPDPRRHRYLRDGSWDATVDLYCPGWRHEWGTQGRVTRGRPRIFIEIAAGVLCVDLPLGPARLAIDDYQRGLADGWLMGKAAWPDRLTIGLEPQANLIARRWPMPRWKEFVDLLRARLHGVQLISFGTSRESRDMARALDAVPAVYLPFPIVAALLRKCAVRVGSDSGLYHMAAALDVPAVGIFGVTDGATTSEVYAKAVYLQAGYEERARSHAPCSHACYNMPSAGKDPERCDRAPCPAMAEISAERVYRALVTRLAV